MRAEAPAPLVVSDAAVTLIGGAPVARADLTACLARAPRLVAADGGADTALTFGYWPEMVIGDMDSLGMPARAALSGVTHAIADQDTTDFEKCLTRIAAPLVLAVGFDGARLDHALAVLNAVVQHPARRCVVVGANDVITLAPPRIALSLVPGTRVSLFPLAPVRGRSAGLEWPLDGIGFAPNGPAGTSNRATGPVEIAMDTPGMLLILPREALGRLLDGLAGASRWPEPGAGAAAP